MKKKRQKVYQKLIKKQLFHFIDFLIEKNLNSQKIFESSESLGKKYLEKYKNPEVAIDKLINKEILKSSMSILVLNIPPFSWFSPANVYVDYIFSAKIIGAIAYMRGRDLHDPVVKKQIIHCILGAFTAKFLKNASTQISKRLLPKILLNLLKKTLAARAIPIAGTIIGIAIDYSFLLYAAQKAKKHFSLKNVPPNENIENKT